MNAPLFENTFRSRIDRIYFNSKTHISVDLKREDEIHAHVSGNKFRKLKYNVLEAISKKRQTILTYGGAFSNHICATASAANLYGLKCIGIIRGEELKKYADSNALNSTLTFAQKQGMQLVFVDRERYRLKDEISEIDTLREKYGDFYRVPEGGTNILAVKGCEEILTQEDKIYDIIACCVGTGGTIAGLINASSAHQNIYGFSALKGHNHDQISTYTKKDNWKIFEDNVFNGYAKTNPQLIEFMNDFYWQTLIKLDPIYTGKMLYRLYDLIEQNHFENGTKILAIHTGGLQGIEGFNQMQIKKGKPILQF